MTRYAPQWLQAQSYPAGTDRRLISAVWPQAAVSGCAVTPQGATMSLNVAPGWVVVPSANSTGSVLCSSDAVETVTLDPAPASGNNRIDLVTCAVSSVDIGTAAGDAFSFGFVKGTPAASNPAVPAVPVGSVAIAQALVVGGSVSVPAANITDRRPPGPGNTVAAGSALVSQVDSNGEVWVAKGGVNGGAWRKARDVLHARMYRAAAWNTATGAVPHAFDTVAYDPYGIWVPGSVAFMAPVAGLYMINGLISIGTGNTPQLYVGMAFGTGQNANDMTGRIRCLLNVTTMLTAGQLVQFFLQTTPGSSTGVTGSTDCWGAIDYLGTG